MIRTLGIFGLLVMVCTSHYMGHQHQGLGPSSGPGHSHGAGLPYGNGQFPTHGPPHSHAGIFLQPIRKVQHNDPSDVLYVRYCKAICVLYVPLKKTCGTNNRVYENDCAAKCDRVSVDASRLKFNETCCCAHQSHKIADFTGFDATPEPIANPTSSFCINVTKSLTGSDDLVSNVFVIPKCLQICLDIDDKNDLEYEDVQQTYAEGCTVGVPV